MIVVMKTGTAQENIDHVIDRLEELGYTVTTIVGVEKTIIGAVGSDYERVDFFDQLRAYDYVDDVLLIS